VKCLTALLRGDVDEEGVDLDELARLGRLHALGRRRAWRSFADDPEAASAGLAVGSDRTWRARPGGPNRSN